MTISQHRYKIGRFILVANVSLFVIIFFLFALNGFTPEELGDILKFLVPIKSIYMTAVVKFVIANKKKVENPEMDKDKITSLYKNVSNLMIYAHIVLLSSAIVFCAFNIISFEALTYSIAIIETFFGAYIGIIITDMFNTDDQSVDNK